MTLYEIDEKIRNLIDEETGEILDPNALDNLEMARDEKLENIALYCKDLDAEAKAIADEIKNLQQRKATAEKKYESLKGLLKYALNGQTFKTARVNISYRKTSSVQVDDEFVKWAMMNGDQYLIYDEPRVSKTEIKEAIKNGIEVPYAHIEEKQSIQIK